jgi:hypothetical protein
MGRVAQACAKDAQATLNRAVTDFDAQQRIPVVPKREIPRNEKSRIRLPLPTRRVASTIERLKRH